jgi:hypothetical protein
MEARDLSVVEHDVTIRAAPDHQRFVFQRPRQPGLAAALEDQHGRLT